VPVRIRFSRRIISLNSQESATSSWPVAQQNRLWTSGRPPKVDYPNCSLVRHPPTTHGQLTVKSVDLPRVAISLANTATAFPFCRFLSLFALPRAKAGLHLRVDDSLRGGASI